MADQALYVGSIGNVLGDGTELVPHVTVANISRGEAEASDDWQPITNGKRKAPASQGGES